MFAQDTRAFGRPRNLFDLPAFFVLGLAHAGSGALALATWIDDARARARRDVPVASRPRGRVGPRDRSPAEMGVPDSWRIR